MYGLSQKNIDSIINVLMLFPNIEAVYLYGSRGKGNFKPSSDIDLMLKGDQLDLSQLTGVMTKLDDLLLPYQFDVALYHQIDNEELLDHIYRVGVNLFNPEVSPKN